MTGYRYLIGIVAVLLFFSGADAYASYAELAGRYKPIIWIGILFFLWLPIGLRFEDGTLRKVPSWLWLWSLAFLVASALWYIPSSQSEIAHRELVIRFEAIGFLVFTVIIYSNERTLSATRWTVLFTTILTVALNIFEMFDQETFISVVDDRAVGLYVNPNRCGAALCFGMALSANLLRGRRRLLYVLWIGLGVVLTFSRSAIVGWLIVALFIVGVDHGRAGRTAVPRRVLALAVPIAALAFLISFAPALFESVDLGNRFDDNVRTRVTFFRTFTANDDSAIARRFVARRAWAAFAENPILGSGLAVSREFPGEGTHNMFLSMLVDHGILGLPLLPLMLWLPLRRLRDDDRPMAYAYCAFAFTYALFSHNVYEDRYFLLTYGALVMHVARRSSRSSEAPARVEPAPIQASNRLFANQGD